jgi:hypothetical protein
MHRPDQDVPMPATSKPLTDRQRRFVAAFYDLSPEGGRLVATRAARIAGYRWPRQQGSRLLAFPHVAAEVERRFRELTRRPLNPAGSGGRKRRPRKRPGQVEFCGIQEKARTPLNSGPESLP